MGIRSFARPELEEFLRKGASPRWLPADIRKRAQRKLVMLDAAVSTQDLRAPPSNRLEALQGELVGFHSIRVNKQWRLIFRWTENGPAQVDIVDYHR